MNPSGCKSKVGNGQKSLFDGHMCLKKSISVKLVSTVTLSHRSPPKSSRKSHGGEGASPLPLRVTFCPICGDALLTYHTTAKWSHCFG